MTKPKPCPICGSIPVMEKTSMDEGNGHGYPDNYWYSLTCHDCGLIHAECNDVYTEPMESAAEICIKQWNKRVKEIQTKLDNKENRLNG